jgi:hypothetical protein
MKTPDYPTTPARNCLYCKHYNNSVNCCNAPNSISIAVFHPDYTQDCTLFKWDKSETPEIQDKNFIKEYCLGKKCPYFYETFKVCTRPSKCPYK